MYQFDISIDLCEWISSFVIRLDFLRFPFTSLSTGNNVQTTITWHGFTCAYHLHAHREMIAFKLANVPLKHFNASYFISYANGARLQTGKLWVRAVEGTTLSPCNWHVSHVVRCMPSAHRTLLTPFCLLTWISNNSSCFFFRISINFFCCSGDISETIKFSLNRLATSSTWE